MKPTEQFKKDFDLLASETSKKVFEMKQGQIFGPMNELVIEAPLSRREAKRQAKARRKIALKERKKK